MICHRLMQGHAASMSHSKVSRRARMPNILEGSACIGSKCALWIRDGVDTGVCAENRTAIPRPDPAKEPA